MRVTIRLEPESGNLRHVRRIAQTWMDAVGAHWDELPLIATELVSNALDVTPMDETVEVQLEASGPDLLVSVRDAGSGLKSRNFAPPPASSVRGRGLAIVDVLADRLTIDRQDGHTLVTARKFGGR